MRVFHLADDLRLTQDARVQVCVQATTFIELLFGESAANFLDCIVFEVGTMLCTCDAAKASAPKFFALLEHFLVPRWHGRAR
jgi:hypothetical protein